MVHSCEKATMNFQISLGHFIVKVVVSGGKTFAVDYDQPAFATNQNTVAGFLAKNEKRENCYFIIQADSVSFVSKNEDISVEADCKPHEKIYSFGIAVIDPPTAISIKIAGKESGEISVNHAV